MPNWFTRMFRGEQRAVSYQDYWGSGADITHVRSDNISTALTLAPVFAATRLLSDSIASLPLQAYRRAGDARVPTDLPMLLQDPSEFGSTYEWVQRAMVSLTLRGNAYGYVTVFDADGFPRRVEWLHPDEVRLGDNQSTQRPQWYWNGRPIESERMIHIPGYVLPGQVLGMSPIVAYALTTETGLLSQQFGRDWFRNGLVPSAVLQTDQPVKPEDATVIKARFRQAVAGREPVVLGLGVEYKPIAVPPNESQFLETMKMTVNQIAAVYGIPPERIGGEASSSRTYANREQDSLDFLTYSLRPYLVKLESHISRLLAPPQYVKFNVDAIVRADLATRYAAHHIALTDGWKSKDEVRELEDLPPLPNGEGSGYGPTPGTPQLPAAPQQEPDGGRRLRLATGDQ